MTIEQLESAIEIAHPQHPHCPCVLVLDISGSMAGERIHQLNEGIRAFTSDVASDDLARKRVDVAIVTFGTDVHLAQDFCVIEEMTPRDFSAGGSTPMGEAITTAVNLVSARKSAYRASGTDYYRPWIFLVTDGDPTDMKPGSEKFREVCDALEEGDRQGEFLFFGVGVDNADMDVLRELCPSERPPIRLRDGKFREMFEWLSRSQRRVSASRVGEHLALPPATGPQGWGEVPTG